MPILHTTPFVIVWYIVNMDCLDPNPVFFSHYPSLKLDFLNY